MHKNSPMCIEHSRRDLKSSNSLWEELKAFVFNQINMEHGQQRLNTLESEKKRLSFKAFSIFYSCHVNIL